VQADDKFRTSAKLRGERGAAILNVSYVAALRLMQKMKGVIDLGAPTRRYKRDKKKLRISGKSLMAFLRSKTRD
jgi:hypothetical protein